MPPARPDPNPSTGGIGSCYDFRVPIYEFYCEGCNTLLNFFSAKIDTSTTPDCPRCGHEGLERRPTTFATPRTGGRAEDEDPFDGLDDSGLERAMEGMAAELEALGDSEDPRQFAGVLRRMGRSAGLELGPKMDELLGRLESGAEIEDLESEMAASGEDDDALEDYFRLGKKLTELRRKRPHVDPELYFF